MLIPFLPYLLALAGITVLLALPVAPLALPVMASGWSVAALYLALPLLGEAVGQLRRPRMGVRRRAQLRHRLVFLAAWLGVLVIVPLPAALLAALQGLPLLGDADEPALVLLLLNFWVGDTLAMSPLVPAGRESWGAQLRRFALALRMPVPVLLLVLVGLALPLFSEDALPGGGDPAALPGLRLAASVGTMLLLAVVAVPVLIRTCWGLVPIPPGPAAEAVRDELAENGVPVAAVLAWPEALMGYATAGVIGLLPRFRYLLISPSLVSALEVPELRAVTAHEAGHLKHRHLWYFFAAVLAFILGMQVLSTGLLWGGLLTGTPLPLWALVALEVGALVLFFRFGIGYVSRHFERQADANALRRLGPHAFEGAITKVGLLNGIPLEQDNWHHYGIGRRIGFAHRAQAEPEALARHDRKVSRIKVALVALLLLAVGAQAAASSPDAMGWLGERYLAYRLDGREAPREADLLPLQFLASRAVQRGDFPAAERYFRAVLRVTPEDPQALNNLAWVLVTQPRPARAELTEGLTLARQAAESVDEAYIWDTLAESYYRLQRYDDAIHAASKALALAEQGAGRGDAPLRYYRERLDAFARHGRGA